MNNRKESSQRTTASQGICTAVEGFPPGWTIQEETKIIKVYIAPNGKKFYSRKKAENYHKISTPLQPPNNRRKASMFRNVGFRNCPRDISKKSDTNRLQLKSVKKLRFYVDPTTGYAFFSKKDAYRYFYSGTIDLCLVKPKCWSNISNNTSKFHVESVPKPKDNTETKEPQSDRTDDFERTGVCVTNVPSPCISEALKAKNSKLYGAILETPLEICKSKCRIALRELNGMNQSPNSSHTLSNKKIHLFAQCEEEGSPDQTIIGASGPGKVTSVSRQNMPGTGSYNSAGEMRATKMNLTPVRRGMGIRAQDTSSPYPTPIISMMICRHH